MLPEDPLIERLPDGAIRVQVGDFTSTVSSEHLVDERIKQLQLRARRSVPMRGSRNPRARWSEDDVREMRRLHLIDKLSTREIARRYKTYDIDVSRIVRWERWPHQDHDLRHLPRPFLDRPQLTPEQQEAKRQRVLERRRERRKAERAAKGLANCSRCIHWGPKTGHCSMGYPEARKSKGAFARDCAVYVEQVPIATIA
jgi:hypothetical protein